MAADQYPPLPKVGPIGFASVVDVQAYAPWLKIGPHLPGVRDVALWTTDQMRAYVDADRAARGVAAAHPQQCNCTECQEMATRLMREAAAAAGVTACAPTEPKGAA